MNTLTITLPSFTVSWVEGYPAEGVNAIETFDLIVNEPCPKELCAFLGRELKAGIQMLAWVDRLRNPNVCRWVIPGLVDGAIGRVGECATMDEAKAEILKQLGVTA